VSVGCFTPSSTISSPQPSVHTTKRSCHSSSVVEPATSSGRKNTTSVALHAVDSSIRHLGDSLSNNFLNPLRSVQSAVTLLYRVAGLSSEHKQFITMHLTKDPAAAVVFISLPNDDTRLSYIADLYSIQNPSATSSSTVVWITSFKLYSPLHNQCWTYTTRTRCVSIHRNQCYHRPTLPDHDGLTKQLGNHPTSAVQCDPA
jgi:hypothetical protein